MLFKITASPNRFWQKEKEDLFGLRRCGLDILGKCFIL